MDWHYHTCQRKLVNWQILCFTRVNLCPCPTLVHWEMDRSWMNCGIWQQFGGHACLRVYIVSRSVGFIWFKSRNGLTCIGAPLTCIVTLHTSFFVSLPGKSFTLLQHLTLAGFTFKTVLSNNKSSETGVTELLTLSLKVILVSPKTWHGDPCIKDLPSSCSAI